LKDCDSEILINGITTVMLGGKCFLNIENKQYSVAKDSFGEKHKLSNREIEIAQQICKGLNNAEIAEKLILSYHTIKTHRKNIYTKLGISNITELIEILQS
jgi:DNA-binding NarL/FixJ family response regulator